MMLCLHVGNTQIYGGLFEEERLRLTFRKITRSRMSADEFGLFLHDVLRTNGIDPKSVQRLSMCSVVPEAMAPLKQACLQYFNLSPFLIQTGIKTGLKILYRNPREVGADRIAGAIAATHAHPGRNLIVVSYGTATTFCAIRKDRTHLGGVILPGVRISLEALVNNAAKISSVEIAEWENIVGRSTEDSVQSGLYHGQIGMTREIIRKITTDAFHDSPPVVICTGEFSGLFESAGLFDEIIPELVLKGLFLAFAMNTSV